MLKAILLLATFVVLAHAQVPPISSVQYVIRPFMRVPMPERKNYYGKSTNNYNSYDKGQEYGARSNGYNYVEPSYGYKSESYGYENPCEENKSDNYEAKSSYGYKAPSYEKKIIRIREAMQTKIIQL